jgi:hypothetical protein
VSTTLTWNGDAFERVIREAAAARVLAAALHFQAEAKKDLGVANPAPHDHPAARGEFPKGRTWNLRDGVVIDPPDLATVRKTLTVRVGWLKGARYGFFLWKKGWKGLADTLARVLPQLRALMGGGGSVEGKSG